jgi:hypothetical protein
MTVENRRDDPTVEEPEPVVVFGPGDELSNGDISLAVAA